jgi:hypothetical protein
MNPQPASRVSLQSQTALNKALLAASSSRLDRTPVRIARHSTGNDLYPQWYGTASSRGRCMGCICGPAVRLIAPVGQVNIDREQAERHVARDGVNNPAESLCPVWFVGAATWYRQYQDRNPPDSRSECLSEDSREGYQCNRPGTESRTVLLLLLLLLLLSFLLLCSRTDPVTCLGCWVQHLKF